MPVDQGLIEWVAEAMEPVGALRVRAMMGGATLYCDNTIFAIVADGELWFKADKASDAVWDEAGCPRFTYGMGGKSGSMNYRRAPETVYDDAEVLRNWALLGLEAGQRSPSRKRPKKKEN